jgi:tetratricopeptide (TPR) repeat protein
MPVSRPVLPEVRLKAQVSWAVLLLGLGCAEGAAVGQKAPAQRTIAVVVVNAHSQPAQPVPVVRVVLSYLYNSVRVNGLRAVTNPRGQAWLNVPADAAQSGGLRIEIDGATDLVIYEPADGELAGSLPATINIRMLPKGSPALLGPAQIEAMLHHTLLQVNTLQKQISSLKQNAAPGQKPDLGAGIAEWAAANGFSPAQVDEQVRQWAAGIQKQAAQSTSAEQKALAALALKNYADAAQLFNAAGDADRQQISAEDSQEQSLRAQVKALEAAQQAFLNKQRTTMQQLLDHSQQAAGAYQLNLQFGQATQALASAETVVEAEYKKHPDDSGFHEQWLLAVWAAATARQREGEVSSAGESLNLLAQSAGDFELLTREYAALGDRQNTASAQLSLGTALMDEGERAGGDKAAVLFDQAVQAYHSALEVDTKADLPQAWAWTQDSLGIALMDEGVRAGGDKAAGLFAQAAEACTNSLQVFTKDAQPQDWARTQDILGGVLMVEGELAGRDQAVALFDQSIEAYQNALQVYTRADFPQNWAGTETNIAGVWLREGERSSGEKAAALFAQAVDAYRKALEVRTKADVPQDWAWTQTNLGTALSDEADRTSVDQTASLLDQAVQAYRSALEVRTKDGLPQAWAATENGLGNALMDEGERAGGDKAAELLAQAGEAFESALQVYTKADVPRNWVVAESNIMEVDLVSSHFAECSKQAEILPDNLLWGSLDYSRDVMRLACTAADGQHAAAQDALKDLFVKAPAVTKGAYDYSGILRFLSNSPAFSNGRASWVGLFTAVQNGDSAGMTAALQQLKPILQQ